MIRDCFLEAVLGLIDRLALRDELWERMATPLIIGRPDQCLPSQQRRQIALEELDCQSASIAECVGGARSTYCQRASLASNDRLHRICVRANLGSLLIVCSIYAVRSLIAARGAASLRLSAHELRLSRRIGNAKNSVAQFGNWADLGEITK